MGPDSKLAFERRGIGFLDTGWARVAALAGIGRLAVGFFFDGAFLRLTFLAAAFFPEAFFFATFFLAVFFFDAFFFEAFFFEAFFFDAFFFADFFFVTDFLLAFFPDFFFDAFLRTDFFFATFLRDEAFLPRLDVAFFLVTLRFLAADFFAEDFFADARLVERFEVFRFLLAVFFAGISYSCLTEKRPGLYMCWGPVEARILPVFTASRGSTVFFRRQSFYCANSFKLPPTSGHLARPHSVCDSAKSSSLALNPL